jgi:hypothetical protein
VYASLGDFGITEDLLDGLKGAAEEVLAEFLEASTSNGGKEVNTLIQRVNFDGGLSGRG